MPIYAYRCTACALEFDLLRPFRDADVPTPCPTCHSSADRRIAAFACPHPGGAVTDAASDRPRRGCGSCSGRSCASCR